jgi:hypothetical protein
MIAETRELELETVEGEVVVYREKLVGIVRESEATAYIMSLCAIRGSPNF